MVPEGLLQSEKGYGCPVLVFQAGMRDSGPLQGHHISPGASWVISQNHRWVSKAVSWPCPSLVMCAGKVPHRTRSPCPSDGTVPIKCSLQCG